MEFEERALDLIRKIVKKQVEEIDDKEILDHVSILVKGNCALNSFYKIVSLEKIQGCSEKVAELIGMINSLKMDIIVIQEFLSRLKVILAQVEAQEQAKDIIDGNKRDVF